MKYDVVATYPKGDRVVLASTRRFNGAVNELYLAVESKRSQLLKKALPADRVVVGSGEEPDGDNVLAVQVVGLITPDDDFYYTYTVERRH